MEKLYEFRTLTAGDIMPMVSILKKIGMTKILSILQPEMTNLTDDGETNLTNSMSFAANLINIILDNLEHCEKDLFKLLGNVSNLGEDGVKKLPLDVFGEMLVDFINKEEFPSFFRVVSRLFDSGQ